MTMIDQPQFNPPATESVATCVARARLDVAGERFVSQSSCVDALLDCLNAAVRPTVEVFIIEALQAVAHLRLVKVAEFVAALDEIQMALQVDAAFDHLELPLADAS